MFLFCTGSGRLCSQSYYLEKNGIMGPIAQESQDLAVEVVSGYT